MANPINYEKLHNYANAYVIYELATNGVDVRETLEGSTLRSRAAAAEGYKYDIYEKYHSRILSGGSYVDMLLEAFPGVNFASYHQKPAIEALLESGGRNRLEEALSALYEGDDDKAAFQQIVDLLNGSFDVLGFIFFLKDRDKYMPIRSRTFDEKFALLDLDSKLSGHCTWEKYQEYNGWLKEVQTYLVKNVNRDFTLLDAHSFVWILNGIAQYLDKEVQIVEHEKYGKGTIIGFGDIYVEVQFPGQKETKKFNKDTVFDKGILRMVPVEFSVYDNEEKTIKKNIDISGSAEIKSRKEERVYSAYNWLIQNEKTATRECDQSFFESNGMAIPKVLKWFFEVEQMKPSDRKDIHILYEGVKHDAHFICDAYDRIRLFWDKALAAELSAFEGLSQEPVVVCHKARAGLLIFEMLVGSDRKKYVPHTEWLVPCNPKTYDCFHAFDNLIKVDWHQYQQLSNVEVNDIIYIYTATPVQAITHQCIVNKVQVQNLEIDDRKYYQDVSAITNTGPFIEVQCVRQFDHLDGLTLNELRNHGISGNIQGAVKVGDELRDHLNKMILEQNAIDRFSDNNMKFVGAMAERDLTSKEDEQTAPFLSDAALFQIAKRKGRKKVITRTVTTVQKSRDPYVAEYAKRRAAGRCQLCGNTAPFEDVNGKPYLESHHIQWLANGGEDTVENTVALCPNCHRKMHIVKDPADVAYLKGINANMM